MITEAPETMELSESAIMRLAENISSMTYGDLQEVAANLRDIHHDRAQDGCTFEDLSDWISLLHDWSTGTIENEQ